MDKGSLSRMVSRLMAESWVKRRLDVGDRRTPRIHLTRAGRRLEAKLLPRGGAVRAEAARGIDESSLVATVRALEQVQRNVDAGSSS